MFPVLDVDGRPVAFGARAMGPTTSRNISIRPRRLRTSKGEHLYGLFQAKDEIRKKKFAILVEGYLDLIALVSVRRHKHRRQPRHCVHAGAVKAARAASPRRSSSITTATMRASKPHAGRSSICCRRILRSRCSCCPTARTLTILSARTARTLTTNARGKATHVPAVLRSTPRSRAATSHNAKQKAEAIEEFLPVISAIRNNIQRRESFDQAMTFFHVEDAALRRELWNALSSRSELPIPQRSHSGSRVPHGQRSRSPNGNCSSCWSTTPSCANVILPQLEQSDYEELATAEIFRGVYRHPRHGENCDHRRDTCSNISATTRTSLDLAHKLLIERAETRRRTRSSTTCCTRPKIASFTLRKYGHRQPDHRRSAARPPWPSAAGDTRAVQPAYHEQLELEKIRRELQSSRSPQCDIICCFNSSAAGMQHFRPSNRY